MSEVESTTEAPVEALLRERLAPLEPLRFEFADDSHLHAGHAGAREGGHYRLVLVSAAFVGKSTVARHRQVFSLLGDLMRTRIHALGIKALAPDEV
ncbi:MAG: BolA family transcriptional regulator, ral stress-responsive regulator [Pseudomonadota bacterium]|jgi:BolA family transcriptional regulator, general stress-responsive regulator|nr:BolA family transcriptional regulator, ral stress-responsive regulator [Pseudomonadota bacterium]